MTFKKSSPHHLPDPTNGIIISWKFKQDQLLILMSSVNLSLVDVQTFPTLWLITHKCQTCKNDSSLDVFLLENYLQLSTSESSAKLGKTQNSCMSLFFFLKIFHALKIGLKGAQRFSDHLIFVSMTYIPNLMQQKPLWVVMFSFRPKSYNTVALFWQIAVAFVFNLVGLRFHILTLSACGCLVERTLIMTEC